MKNILCISVFFSIAIYLGGYSNTSILKPTITPQNNYIVSDNYTNHRIQQKRFVSSGGKIAYLDYRGDDS